MVKFIAIFFLFQINVLAQEKSGDDLKEKISISFKKLGTVEIEEFPELLEKLRLNLGRYVEKKRRVCRGDFSQLILNEQKRTGEEVRKLEKKERDLCYRELKFLQQEFIKQEYAAKKRYLGSIHQETLKSLKEDYEDSLARLEKTFSSSRRKKR